MTTGGRIKDARKAVGLTQGKLAEAIGAATSTVRMYELDKRTPSREALEKIAKTLGVTPESLVDQGFSTVAEVAEALFQMDQAGFGIRPVYVDDKIMLDIDLAAPHAPKLVMAIEEWQKRKQAYENGDMSRVEYYVMRLPANAQSLQEQQKQNG